MHHKSVLLLLSMLYGCSATTTLTGNRSDKMPVERPFSPLVVECETDHTTVTGERKECEKRQCRYDAGILIAQGSVRRAFDHGGTSGEEPRCNLEFLDYVEVVRYTGISEPMQLCVTVNVKSPGGVFNGGVFDGKRGKVKCVVTGYQFEAPVSP